MQDITLLSMKEFSSTFLNGFVLNSMEILIGVLFWTVEMTGAHIVHELDT